jgi:hypothetical protein
MYPHRIRLRGPWDMTAAGQAPKRVAFPTTWAAVDLPDYVGQVTFERRFGYPGRIDAHERVWLVGHGMAIPATIDFQGERLGVVTASRFAFDVTQRLRERNLLKLTLEIVAGRAGLWDDIALEVRATAYLEDVARDGLAIRGRVAGTCDGKLEIYVLAANRTCGYSEVRAGEAFTIALEGADGPLRVELINVATVWDVVELEPP